MLRFSVLTCNAIQVFCITFWELAWAGTKLFNSIGAKAIWNAEQDLLNRWKCL